MEVRPYQEATINDAVEFLDSAAPGDTRLYKAPTGSGKSYIGAGILARVPGGYLVAPTYDILRGFAEKLGIQGTQLELEGHGFYTPIRLRNQLLRGEVPSPKYFVIDEAHHSEAETYKLLDALAGKCPAIGLTATDFRGSPRSTAQFREYWGESVVVITLQEAVEQGYISMPTCSIVPLLDDDVIEISNGEFVVESTERQVESITSRVISMLKPYYSGRWDRPTMLRLPSVQTAKMYAECLSAAGLPCVCITGEDDPETRDKAFADTLKCTHALVAVQVVREGVDLAIRRLVDLAPMMSPVEWQQQFGRATRPTGPNEPPPEYICTNRNLLRHAYLLEGLVPLQVYIEGEKSFGGPSERKAYRAIGFEGLGKFKPVDVPLANGTQGQMVCIEALEGNLLVQYAAIASPLSPEVLYAKKESVKRYDGTKDWGKWYRIPELPELEAGYTSVHKGRVTPGQQAWWRGEGKYRGRGAARVGLDESAPLNTKMFQALPILSNCNYSFN